jgi:hypothetical protein
MWSEAEFLDVIRTKVLRVFLLAIHSHLPNGFYPPPPPHPEQSVLNLVCNVNIVYRKPHKPQRNCTFMNLGSGRQLFLHALIHTHLLSRSKPSESLELYIGTICCFGVKLIKGTKACMRMSFLKGQ